MKEMPPAFFPPCTLLLGKVWGEVLVGYNRQYLNIPVKECLVRRYQNEWGSDLYSSLDTVHLSLIAHNTQHIISENTHNTTIHQYPQNPTHRLREYLFAHQPLDLTVLVDRFRHSLHFMLHLLYAIHLHSFL